MNNSIWIWVVVALVVIGGIWYFMSGSPSTTTPPATTTTTTTTTTGTTPDTGTTGTALAAPSGTGTGTFGMITGRTGNYTCTFNTQAPTGQSTGALYVTQGQSRADFRTDNAASGRTTTSHIIRTGGVVYTWVDGMTSGFKTTDPNGTTIPKQATGGGFVATNTTSNVSWDCHAWLPDPTQFAIPKALSFIDTTAE